LRLKKLELIGFKSFADRTVFEFEDSLSALVGPNGAGKSNVVDALRWVLGERSAQRLRGSEMTNVIFDGSSSRKPLNFAQVTLTIDNSDRWLPVDYEEVTIRRTLDRSGQSDYSLNGRPCRLKDIRALLLDTGAGTATYSFIEQGQVDRLLHSSPKERRQVFEEAAGINRFLQQCAEAERKIERVAQNLARVTDILEEVERQLRSVKYQAARARTYKQHVEKLQRLRLAHALHSYRRLQREREQQGRRIRTIVAERDGLAETALRLESNLEAERHGLQTAQDELADARQSLTRIEARIEALQREAELNRNRADELERRMRELEARRDSLEQRAATLRADRERAEAELARNGEELARKADQFDALTREAEAVRRQLEASAQGIEAAKGRVFDLFQRESRLGNQLQVLAAERRTLQHRVERISSRRQQLRKLLGEAEAECNRAQEALGSLQARRHELDSALRQCREAAARAEEELERLVGRHAELAARLSAAVSRRDVLRDLEERAEGIASGVKRILEARPAGLVGMLAHMLEVPLELTAAVEAALGPLAQALVFQDAAAARSALDLLSDGSPGRADIIVLEWLRVPAEAAAPDDPALRGRLSDLISPAGAATAPVRALLGNTFLVQDRAAADRILASGLAEGVRLVTPLGECFTDDGIWSAGAQETPTPISRRSELAELERQIAELQGHLATVAEERARASRELERLRAEQQELASRMQTLTRQEAEAHGRVDMAKRKAKELAEELRLGAAEEAGLREDISQAEQRSVRLEAECESTARERAAAQKDVQARQEGLQALQVRQQELAERLRALNAEVASARERQRSLQTLIGRVQAETNQLGAERASLQSRQEEARRQARQAREAVEAAGTQAAELQTARAELARALEDRDRAIVELRARIEAASEAVRQAARQRQDVEERLHAARMAENETGIKMQELLRRIAESEGVRLEALELDPESWRQNPPFTSRVIRQFAEQEAEGPAQPEPVADWYRQLEEEPTEQPRQDEGPEPVDLEDAVALRQAVLEIADSPATDWDAVQAEAARLKALIDRIGTVNVDAIRQQEELEIRRQFLTDQKDDLEKARRREREIIRELNKKSRERFAETFQQARQNFQGLFRKLFGGGSADLVLQDDEDDILEAGIEIVARPPGKEPSSLSLLSGGERALTAIALLFALFQTKPSPFCLLDEVDAPLDDANVERFLTLLEEFRGRTQFIVATHNKLTMSVAQVLYGLTIADGVSKKISVRFEEVDSALGAPPGPRAKAG